MILQNNVNSINLPKKDIDEAIRKVKIKIDKDKLRKLQLIDLEMPGEYLG